MAEIKAIPTKYKGINFRSRLEARWAVFFDSMGDSDSMGIRWEYEKEGYQLRSGWYLPDFWLPEMQLWIEVKPEGGVCEHAESLRDQIGFPVLVTSGLPDNPMVLYCHDDSDGSAGTSEFKTCGWMWYGKTVIVVSDSRKNRRYCNADFSTCSSLEVSDDCIDDGDFSGSGHISPHKWFDYSVNNAKRYQFNY